MSRRYVSNTSFNTSFPLPGTTSHTTMCWAYIATSSIGNASLLEIANNAVTSWTNITTTATQVVFQELNASTNAYIYAVNFPGLDQWHHYCLRYDATLGQFTSFIDGAQANTASGTLAARPNLNFVRFGDLFAGGTLNVTLQDAMVFSGVALTDAQIYSAMTTGVAPASTFAWYQMYPAAPILDSSGNGRTLTTGGVNGDLQLIYGSGSAVQVAGAGVQLQDSLLVASGSATRVAGSGIVDGANPVSNGSGLGNNGPPTSRHWLGRRNLRERL